MASFNSNNGANKTKTKIRYQLNKVSEIIFDIQFSLFSLFRPLESADCQQQLIFARIGIKWYIFGKRGLSTYTSPNRFYSYLTLQFSACIMKSHNNNKEQ